MVVWFVLKVESQGRSDYGTASRTPGSNSLVEGLACEMYPSRPCDLGVDLRRRGVHVLDLVQVGPQLLRACARARSLRACLAR